MGFRHYIYTVLAGNLTLSLSLSCSGSHQNVFTTKLVEGLALSQQHTKILSLEDFPTGR